MYTAPTNTTLPDVRQFINLINHLPKHANPAARMLFAPDVELFIARAPGRMDLMGGIADYSGSLVLQLPIREATLAAIQKTPDRTISIVSLSEDRPVESSHFSMPLDDFFDQGRPLDYAVAQGYFQRATSNSTGDNWPAYIAGTLLVLMRERNLQFDSDHTCGVRILIHSTVPEGKGVSSSAALEVATMTALASAFDVPLSGRELALLCQMVENHIVGAPCGIMDQMSAACGEENRLLSLNCQPAELGDPVSIPDELAVWGIDSGIRHAVSGADYGSVRVGAFMGYRMLLDMAGIAPTALPASKIVDTKWRGYLANVAPSEFEQLYVSRLPESLSGAEFLDQYTSTTDTVTTVDPAQSYAVRQPTTHPIYEHFRVKTFAQLLQGDALANAQLLGECMYQSHASYSACRLGSDGTDELVALARLMGAEKGIYGAKITGGGSGGTVTILGRHDAEGVVIEIAQKYAAASGKDPYLFHGSSLGAAAFGSICLRPNG